MSVRKLSIEVYDECINEFRQELQSLHRAFHHVDIVNSICRNSNTEIRWKADMEYNS